MAKRTSGRKIIAANMRARRAELELSQDELAHRSGLHRTYIGAVEREERNISIDNIDKIAAALRVPTAKLLT